MSEYIKKEDAIKEANTWSMFGNDNLESRLKRLPSADVVEVSKILKTADEQEKQGFIQTAMILRELVK